MKTLRSENTPLPFASIRTKLAAPRSSSALQWVSSTSKKEQDLEAFLRKLGGQDCAIADYLAEGIALGQKTGFRRLELSLQAERVRIYLEKGETAQAFHYAKASGFLGEQLENIPSGSEAVLQEIADEVKVRIALAQGENAKAKALLGKLEEAAQQQGRRLHQIRYRLLQLRLALQVGEAARAAKILTEAFCLAQEESCVMIFVEAARFFPKFLVAHLKTLAALDSAFAEQISQALSLSSTNHVGTFLPSQETAPVEALTRRELEILGAIYSSLSYPAVAKSLFISQHTLKWHLKNIYGKLGVANRTAAILKGKALGLIAAA